LWYPILRDDNAVADDHDLSDDHGISADYDVSDDHDLRDDGYIYNIKDAYDVCNVNLLNLLQTLLDETLSDQHDFLP